MTGSILKCWEKIRDSMPEWAEEMGLGEYFSRVLTLFEKNAGYEKRYEKDLVGLRTLLVLCEDLKVSKEGDGALGDGDGQKSGWWDLAMAVGHALFVLGDYRSAMDVYEKLLRHGDVRSQEGDGSLAPLYNNIGICLVRMGDVDGGIEFYRKAIETSPTGTYWFNLGKALVKKGDYEKAVEAFKKCVSLEPDNKSGWNNLGVCYRNLGEYREAERCYRRSLAIDPEYVWGWHNLGVLYFFLGDRKKARGFFGRALATNPSFGPSRAWMEAVAGKRWETEKYGQRKKGRGVGGGRVGGKDLFPGRGKWKGERR